MGQKFEKIQIFGFEKELVTLEDFVLSAKTKYVTTTSRDAEQHRDSKRFGLWLQYTVEAWGVYTPKIWTPGCPVER